MPVSTDNVLRVDTAWFLVEQFLNDTSSEHRDEQIEQARLQAVRVAQESTGIKHRIRAQMLLANFPLLALRGYRQKIEADDIAQSYHMMAGVVADVARHYKKNRAVPEAITFALIARQRDTMNIPFVGSPRERKSLWPGGSHGVYTVDDSVTLKTAVHVCGHFEPEESVRQTPFVHPCHLGDFLTNNSRGLEALRGMPVVSSSRILGEAAARLIVNEPSDGYPSGSPEDIALTTLSDRLIARLNDHRLKVLGLSSQSKSVQKTPRHVLSKLPPPRRLSTPTAQPLAPKPEPKPKKLAPKPTVRPHEVFFINHNNYKFISPYLPAESIPAEVLEQQPIVSDNQVVDSLWKNIELGIALRDREQVLRMGDEAQNVAYDSKQDALARVNAAMLYANSGLLALRAAGEMATESDMLKSFQAMARVLNNVLSNNYGELERTWQAGKIPELINYCLVAYSADPQYVPYLAACREERTWFPVANHDMYTMPSKTSASKVATQIKSRFHEDVPAWLGTPENIRRSFVFPIYTEEVLHSHAVAIKSREQGRVSYVARFIVRAANNDLTSVEKIIFQSYSRAILQLFADHREYLRAEQEYHTMPYTNLSPEEYRESL